MDILIGSYGSELVAWLSRFPWEAASFAFFVATLVWAIVNWDWRSTPPGEDLDLGSRDDWSASHSD